MSCVKNLYELFGVTAPEYDIDEIWYLGYSLTQSTYPYTNVPQDVVLQSGFDNPNAFQYPTVNNGGIGGTELISSNYGGFVPIPSHPNNYYGVKIAAQHNIFFKVDDYCQANVNDPYLTWGFPSQPGFYFFLRKVSNQGCIVFSNVQVLQVGVGGELPDDKQYDISCQGDDIDCFDATIYLDPDNPNFVGDEDQCMYPPYNPDYWDVDNPECIDLTEAGVYVITYTVPAQDLNLVFNTDPNCDTCGTEDLVITLTLTVGGPTTDAPPITLCN